MEERNTVWTVAIVCVIVYLVVMLYNMAKIEAYNPIVMFGMIAGIIGITVANVWGDFFTFLRAPPEFITVSGVGGRLLSGPEPIPGGKLKCRVAFNRAVVPRHLKDNRSAGLTAVLAGFLGSIVLEVVGDKHQFRKVDPRDSENPNGAWIFVGRLDGAELNDSDILTGLSDMRVLADKVGALAASYRIYGQELAMLVNQRHMDDDETANRLKTIADNMKNVKIISKGAGGGAAEAIAAEMG